jgi:hypothetical protein
LLVAGCANGYKQFYTPAAGITPEAIASRRVAPPPETPILERAPSSAEPSSILAAYAKRSYIMIGSSNFNSGKSESDSAAIEQARTIGADLVLVLNPKYTGSTTSQIPITTPTSSTSYTTANATAFGPGGTVNAFGSGTTTTYGSTTSYVPVTVHRADYGAIYFIKTRYALGAFFRDLNDAERQELQTNRGAVVTIVADDSPAFNSDILPGDIISSINGEILSNGKSATDQIRENRGKLITLSISRRGQKIEKQIQLKY